MSQPTYEGVLALIQSVAKQSRRNERKFDKLSQTTDKLSQTTAEHIEATNKHIEATNKHIEATNKYVEATNKTVASLSDRVGDMSEKLLGEGSLVDQFQELGHEVRRHSQRMKFGKKGTAESGEIDLFLEDGDVAILLEAKTTLKKDHVTEHIERIEKYRRFADAEGYAKKRLIGAVAGTVIAENVIDYAHEKGLYVIIQSARAVEIIPPPTGFVAHEW